MKTLEKLNKNIEDLRKNIAKGYCIDGTYGLNECKKSVRFDMTVLKKPLQQIYAEQVKYCLERPLHNEMMIIACEEVEKEELATSAKQGE